MIECICRLCLCKLELQELEEKRSNRRTLEDVKEILCEIFQIDLKLERINKKENFEVCLVCREKLKVSHEFYQTIQRSQTILRGGILDQIIVAENQNVTESVKAELLDTNIEIKSEDEGSIDEEVANEDDDDEEDNYEDNNQSDSDEEFSVRTRRKSKRQSTRSAKEKSSKPKKLRAKTEKKLKTRKPLTEDTVSDEILDNEDRQILDFFSLKCESCQESFEKFSFYKTHFIEKHDEKRPAIVCCNTRFDKRWRLLEHLYLHTNPEKYKCPDCGKQCTNSYRLRQHIRQNHESVNERQHQCEKCSKRFLTPANLRAHLRTHLSKEEKERLKTHICNECGNGFVSKHILEHHMRQIHLKLYACVCDICAKTFKTKADFLYHRTHVHASNTQPKVQCKVCLSWFSSERRLNAHFRRIHKTPGPHICSICGKISPTSEALKSHQRNVHEAQRKYQCSYCSKAFKKEVNLKEHMTTHVGGALYTCCFCDKTFNSNANMYSHRKKVHPVENEKMLQEKRNEKLPQIVQNMDGINETNLGNP